jgi:hypothetical protein
MKRPWILAVAALLSLGAAAYSQTLSISLSSGIFFAKDEDYRGIYGRSIPFEAEARFGFLRYLGLTVGLSYVGDKGQAINLNQGRDEYPVRFRMISVPLAVCFVIPVGETSLFGGAGASVHSYEEKWETVPISHKGNKIGPMACAGVELRVFSRFRARFSLRYELVKTGLGPYQGKKINLGGMTLLGGVSFRIF